MASVFGSTRDRVPFIFVSARNSTQNKMKIYSKTSAPPLHRRLHNFKTQLHGDGAIVQIMAAAEPLMRGIW